jgi:K+-sensing histidine kinase KdpD
VLALSELAILTLVVVGFKAVMPVEALASLYVLAVLPIAVGWGFAWALTVAVLSTLMFDLLVTPPLFALTITRHGNRGAAGDLCADRLRGQ